MFSVSSFAHVRKCAGATLILLAAGSLSDAAEARNRNRDADNNQAVESTLSGRPVVAVVSIKDQRISVYDAKGEVMHAGVSTGQTDYETPVGVYSILQKQEEHYSNIYDDASMPFMQRITWSGIALHAGALPGYPASHGCVRMPYNFASRLFPLTRLGMRVVVAHDDVAPSDVSHPLLPKPVPAGDVAIAVPATFEDGVTDQDQPDVFVPEVSKWPARAAQMQALKSMASEKSLEAQTATSQADELKSVMDGKKAAHAKTAKHLKRAEAVKKRADKQAELAAKKLAAATKPSVAKRAEARKEKADAAAKIANDKFDAAKAAADAAEQELTAATNEWKKADEVKAAAVGAMQKAKWKTYPVSMFVSRKTQRLYVRQGNEPVFDAPITISQPDEAIGTHVFTAVDYKDKGKDLRWQVVSIARRSAEDIDAVSYKKRRKADVNYDAPATDVASATDALDRITIPPEVASQISGYVWPGSSLIVSDEPLSKETGKATDFVVVISTEPQGSLKKRPRRPAPSQYVRDDPYDYYDERGRNYRYDPYDRYDRRYRNKPTFFNWW
jgi:hypothetical protein